MANNVAFLSLAFRPMFLLAALAGLLMPALWVSYFTGHSIYSATLFKVLDWHAYEMYSGFASAVVAGFLLTASANWSGKCIRGLPLLLLAASWLLERVLLLSNVPFLLQVVAAAMFSLTLFLLLFLQLKNNKHNFVIFIPWLFLFLAARFLFLFAAWVNQPALIIIAKNIFLSSLLLLIAIITGRIIPFFIQKRLGQRPMVTPWVEKSAVISILILVFAEVFPLPHSLLAALFVIAFILNLIRFFQWQPVKTLAEPMLLILVLGYLWMLVHLALKAYGFLVVDLGPVVVHVFTAGALGTFAIGMMTRVSLGHTGRSIRADWLIWAMFTSLTIGALLRVLFPLVWPQYYIQSLHYSSGFWTLTFLFFLLKFVPILFRKRLAD